MEPIAHLPTDGAYDEALERFHRTGPEFDGYLSNHGPMVVEALARLDRADRIHAWTDRYIGRLDESPRGIQSLRPDDWREALGDPARTGDWIAYFAARGDDQPWPDLLETWWPRLLPGIAGGATHGVIRVGHAVRALRAADTAPRRQELAHALAYWASVWRVVPLGHARGQHAAAAAVASVPRVADQGGGDRPPAGPAGVHRRVAGQPGSARRPHYGRAGPPSPGMSRARGAGPLCDPRARQPDDARARSDCPHGGAQHPAGAPGVAVAVEL